MYFLQHVEQELDEKFFIPQLVNAKLHYFLARSSKEVIRN